MSMAINSSLQGYAMAQAQYGAAAQNIAGAGLQGDPAIAGPDLLESVVSAQLASTQMDVSLAMLSKSLDQQGKIIDILA